MAGAKIAKRNIEGLRVRKLEDKVVKPVLFNGRSAGLGKYLAGSFDNGNTLIENQDGTPIPYYQIGILQDA